MTTTTIDAERSLADLVEENPEFARVFESYGIDFCCGGDASLETACAEAGLKLSTVRDELAAVTDSDGTQDWETMSDLVDHIVSEHHEYLREELPALEDLVQKVVSVHGENHPELQRVGEEFSDLAEAMQTHISEEEDEAFLLVEKLDRGEPLTESEVATLREEIDNFEDDHEETAARLEQIKALTDGYAVPDDACPSYRNMLARLEELERDTHMHVHRENNILFSRAEQELSTATRS
ncbi:iron-sulfur cluster repair di-iron protein [Halorussus aquaticus]|uniref:Iron-sulfur cluster repair di-iron protein n=1 Tax=Halorussus aquaticus TaxID=2953748 RepID=A0ABD5QAL0_9EURY|nr:iron-sulfur cluster repair di-iron protein [Halorussus aquaticus]